MNEQGISLIIESKRMERLMDIFNVLSKPDAMTIFLLAKDGLAAETEAPYKIGLTRKQYYTRLKQLVDLGLIERSEGVYHQTMLGKLIYNEHVVELSNALEYDKELKMVDILKKSGEFNTDEITQFLTKIAGDKLSVKCEMILSWDKMVDTIIKRLENAQKEILLASRFYSEKIINAIIQRNSLGVSSKIIVDVPLFKSYVKKFTENIRQDKHAEEREKIVTNPWYGLSSNVERRFANLHFSILTIDGKECFIELVDACNPTEFYGCVFIKDEDMTRSVKQRFSEIWNESMSEEKAKMMIKNGII